MSSKKRNVDNDRWIRDHFEMIVDRYGGKFPYVLVAAGRVFPVKSGRELPKLEEEIRRKFGPPVGMPVPKREDFVSVLFLVESVH